MRTRSWGTRYAVVASTLALVLALSGTAYAVATVRSADIVDGTIIAADVADGRLSRLDMATTSLGRSPRMFFTVQANGNAFTRGGISATHPQTGVYKLTFSRSLADCAISVTPVAEVVTGTFDSYVSFAIDGAELTVVVRKEADQALNNNGFHAIAVC
ncbi:MAG: hypothetical protein JNK12_04370 [Acidimicrobiales bacterium]|nr:hypothetical protein [Acidimicrobiales bacterium]